MHNTCKRAPHSVAVMTLAAWVLVNGAQAQTLPPPPVSPAPVVTYEYDAQGSPTKTTQAKGVPNFGFETKASYDALGRRKDTTDAKQGLTRFGYNGREDLTQVIDPRTLITQYPRNGLGDAKQLISPDTGTANLTYDEAGNLKTRTDSRGVLATYTYDALNRLTGVVYSQSGQPSLSQGWTYDETGAGFAYGIGRLTSTTHPSGSRQHTYDPQGRLVTDIQRVNATTGANTAQVSTTVTYGYDPAGHVTSIVYPSGRKLTITHTGGVPSAMSLAKDAVAAPANLISQIQWQPFGPAKSWLWQFASSTQPHTRFFDTSGRLTRYPLGGSIRDLTYDAADRIAKYTHYSASTGAAQPALDQGFSYDELGRLAHTTLNTGTAYWDFSYDANGNRSAVTVSGTTRTYSTASTSNRLTSISNPSRSFGYDNAGNTKSDLSSGNSYTASYDLSGRMVTLTKAGVTATYNYDGMGRRVRKFTTAGAASTVIFVYDQQGHLLGEYDSAGKAMREYVWLGDIPIAAFVPPVIAGNPPVVYFIHADHLDTPQVVVDKNNAIRWQWFTEPFGVTAPNTNPSGLGVFTFNLRFPGQYFDQESGLLYNMARYYGSDLGRYTQADPIGLGGGINTYSYSYSQPTRFTDPSGLFVPIVVPAVEAIVEATLARQAAISAGRAIGAAAVASAMQSSSTMVSDWPNEWELELEFLNDGPKGPDHQCTNNYDDDCKKRLAQLLKQYGAIRRLELRGADTSHLKRLYNQVADRYHRNCPYWQKAPQFGGFFLN